MSFRDYQVELGFIKSAVTGSALGTFPLLASKGYSFSQLSLGLTKLSARRTTWWSSNPF